MAATPMPAANSKPVKPRRAHRPSDGRSPETARLNVFMRACGPEGWRAASCPSLPSCSSRRASASSARPGFSWFSVESISAPHPVQCRPHEAARAFTLGGHSTGPRLFLRLHAANRRTSGGRPTRAPWRGFQTLQEIYSPARHECVRSPRRCPSNEEQATAPLLKYADGRCLDRLPQHLVQAIPRHDFDLRLFSGQKARGDKSHLTKIGAHGHLRLVCCGLCNLTPGPPPFSSMNSTPAVVTRPSLRPDKAVRGDRPGFSSLH
jgi:hypothetical protein